MNFTKIMPILKQIYKVANILEASLNSLISVAQASGLNMSDSMLDIISKVISGAQSIKSALEKIIGFFGGELETMSALSEADIEAEIKKLNDLI